MMQPVNVHLVLHRPCTLHKKFGCDTVINIIIYQKCLPSTYKIYESWCYWFDWWTNPRNFLFC